MKSWVAIQCYETSVVRGIKKNRDILEPKKESREVKELKGGSMGSKIWIYWDFGT